MVSAATSSSVSGGDYSSISFRTCSTTGGGASDVISSSSGGEEDPKLMILREKGTVTTVSGGDRHADGFCMSWASKLLAGSGALLTPANLVRRLQNNSSISFATSASSGSSKDPQQDARQQQRQEYYTDVVEEYYRAVGGMAMMTEKGGECPSFLHLAISPPPQTSGGSGGMVPLTWWNSTSGYFNCTGLRYFSLFAASCYAQTSPLEEQRARFEAIDDMMAFLTQQTKGSSSSNCTTNEELVSLKAVLPVVAVLASVRSATGHCSGGQPSLRLYSDESCSDTDFIELGTISSTSSSSSTTVHSGALQCGLSLMTLSLHEQELNFTSLSTTIGIPPEEQLTAMTSDQQYNEQVMTNFLFPVPLLLVSAECSSCVPYFDEDSIATPYFLLLFAGLKLVALVTLQLFLLDRMGDRVRARAELYIHDQDPPTEAMTMVLTGGDEDSCITLDKFVDYTIRELLHGGKYRIDDRLTMRSRDGRWAVKKLRNYFLKKDECGGSYHLTTEERNELLAEHRVVLRAATFKRESVTSMYRYVISSFLLDKGITVLSREERSMVEQELEYMWRLCLSGGRIFAGQTQQLYDLFEYKWVLSKLPQLQFHESHATDTTEDDVSVILWDIEEEETMTPAIICNRCGDEQLSIDTEQCLPRTEYKIECELDTPVAHLLGYVYFLVKKKWMMPKEQGGKGMTDCECHDQLSIHSICLVGMNGFVPRVTDPGMCIKDLLKLHKETERSELSIGSSIEMHEQIADRQFLPMRFALRKTRRRCAPTGVAPRGATANGEPYNDTSPSECEMQYFSRLPGRFPKFEHTPRCIHSMRRGFQFLREATFDSPTYDMEVLKAITKNHIRQLLDPRWSSRIARELLITVGEETVFDYQLEDQYYFRDSIPQLKKEMDSAASRRRRSNDDDGLEKEPKKKKNGYQKSNHNNNNDDDDEVKHESIRITVNGEAVNTKKHKKHRGGPDDDDDDSEEITSLHASALDAGCLSANEVDGMNSACGRPLTVTHPFDSLFSELPEGSPLAACSMVQMLKGCKDGCKVEDSGDGANVTINNSSLDETVKVGGRLNIEELLQSKPRREEGLAMIREYYNAAYEYLMIIPTMADSTCHQCTEKAAEKASSTGEASDEHSKHLQEDRRPQAKRTSRDKNDPAELEKTMGQEVAASHQRHTRKRNNSAAIVFGRSMTDEIRGQMNKRKVSDGDDDGDDNDKQQTLPTADGHIPHHHHHWNDDKDRGTTLNNNDDDNVAEAAIPYKEVQRNQRRGLLKAFCSDHQAVRSVLADMYDRVALRLISCHFDRNCVSATDIAEEFREKLQNVSRLTPIVSKEEQVVQTVFNINIYIVAFEMLYGIVLLSTAIWSALQAQDEERSMWTRTRWDTYEYVYFKFVHSGTPVGLLWAAILRWMTNRENREASYLIYLCDGSVLFGSILMVLPVILTHNLLGALMYVWLLVACILVLLGIRKLMVFAYRRVEYRWLDKQLVPKASDRKLNHSKLRLILVVIAVWIHFMSVAIGTFLVQSSFDLALMYYRRDEIGGLSYLQILQYEWNSRAAVCYFESVFGSFTNGVQLFSYILG